MASRSLNKVILIGNLTRDPELKYTPTGTPVCSFGLATNRNWTTSDGQQKEEVQYHRIVAWQKLAELCAKLLTKGKKVYLEGRITYRTFTAKDGQERSVAEIVLDDFIVFNGGTNKKIASDSEEKNNKSIKEEEKTEKAETQNNEELSGSEEELKNEADEQLSDEVQIDENDMPF